MELTIRQEREQEYKQVEEIVRLAFLNEAFSDKKEHQLVARLRKSDAFIPELSLVAIHNDEVIGHVLLTTITIVHDEKAVQSLALAPVSVEPTYQGKGIGSKLIVAALEKAKELSYQSVVVLGHQDYYPKFGFKKASLWKIKAPFEVPDEVFMALELNEHTLDAVQGVVHYSKAFFE
ncbi:GNAT family N-acetyltransferase [Priestia taiwanensis]|uniref:N-acetyltransferase n=1 Tax=Priestia taiwanensis TaxID=1347902 RepID=A0A917AM65_9BACI|nr:N-acetyltransferase [Priestia taiwanensis]MBM7362365.1 putative N-acetyltransferase YhbS [Priestia taiwanensis]GGE61601.1 N-acetyltransferase [Priestia taiwanensis]